MQHRHPPPHSRHPRRQQQQQQQQQGDDDDEAGGVDNAANEDDENAPNGEDHPHVNGDNNNNDPSRRAGDSDEGFDPADVMLAMQGDVRGEGYRDVWNQALKVGNTDARYAAYAQELDYQREEEQERMREEEEARRVFLPLMSTNSSIHNSPGDVALLPGEDAPETTAEAAEAMPTSTNAAEAVVGEAGKKKNEGQQPHSGNGENRDDEEAEEEDEAGDDNNDEDEDEDEDADDDEDEAEEDDGAEEEDGGRQRPHRHSNLKSPQASNDAFPEGEEEANPQVLDDGDEPHASPAEEALSSSSVRKLPRKQRWWWFTGSRAWTWAVLRFAVRMLLAIGFMLGAIAVDDAALWQDIPIWRWLTFASCVCFSWDVSLALTHMVLWTAAQFTVFFELANWARTFHFYFEHLRHTTALLLASLMWLIVWVVTIASYLQPTPTSIDYGTRTFAFILLWVFLILLASLAQRIAESSFERTTHWNEIENQLKGEYFIWRLASDAQLFPQDVVLAFASSGPAVTKRDPRIMGHCSNYISRKFLTAYDSSSRVYEIRDADEASELGSIMFHHVWKLKTRHARLLRRRAAAALGEEEEKIVSQQQSAAPAAGQPAISSASKEEQLLERVLLNQAALPATTVATTTTTGKTLRHVKVKNTIPTERDLAQLGYGYDFPTEFERNIIDKRNDAERKFQRAYRLLLKGRLRMHQPNAAHMDEGAEPGGGKASATQQTTKAKEAGAFKTGKRIAFADVRLVYSTLLNSVAPLPRYAPDAIFGWARIIDPANRGFVTENTFRQAMQRYFQHRVNVGATLRDARAAVERLGIVLLSLANVLAVLFGALIYAGGSSYEVWLAIMSFFVAAAVVFGNMLATTFENIVFLFFRHNFDVGDLLVINDDFYSVRRLELLSTLLIKWSGQYMLVENTWISKQQVLNLTRSGLYWHMVDVQLDIATCTPEFVNCVRASLRKYIAKRPESFSGDFQVCMSAMNPPLHVTLSLWIEFSYHPNNLLRLFEDIHRAHEGYCEALRKYGATFSGAGLATVHTGGGRPTLMSAAPFAPISARAASGKQGHGLPPPVQAFSAPPFPLPLSSVQQQASSSSEVSSPGPQRPL